MEFEDVDERIAWEAQRVAFALGVETPAISSEVIWEWGDQHWGKRENVKQYTALFPEGEAWWNIRLETQTVSLVSVEDKEELGCQVAWIRGRWELNQSQDYAPFYRQLLARALYRLGIEDHDVLTALDHPLTAHEKLELRLSMPREFWPNAWLEDDDG